ncbi:hypothetical protein M885DRAFT_552936 [Pelagophyceae sp. CCMP2097]|nr:hypothetical protein M885DRAFT_552936 [Pelagophyceae sp. CCMP2097]
MLLRALDEAAKRELAFSKGEWPNGARRGDGGDAFRARGSDGGAVPVLHLTGPAMLGDAILDWLRGASPGAAEAPGAPASLRALRERHGGDADRPETWAAVSVAHAGGGAVVLLPFCFCRSRGCRHLGGAPWYDRVVFHHGFETSWRKTFFHNFSHDEPPPEAPLRRRHARRVDWPTDDEEL